MDPKVVIHTDNVSKVYDLGNTQVHALRHVSLEIRHGEMVAIMGPSGSGKSTFMNIVGCLDVPTSGTYLLDGLQVSEMDENQLAEIRNSKMGFVFQQFNLLARTSAIRQVQLPMIYSGTPDRENRARLALEAVGLGDRIHHTPVELSGGQQQRIAIARALVNDPVLILADEPTGALDSRTGQEVLNVFQQLNQMGKTVIMVTHEFYVAEHCRRIIRFRDGLITSDEEVTSPRDALEELARLPDLDAEDNVEMAQ